MKIIAHGIDLVDFERIEQMLQKHPERFPARVFTQTELADADRHVRRIEKLAGRFAAKEAALKALGTGKLPDIRWTDLEILRAGSEGPRLELGGGARLQAERLGATRVWVSMSHEAGLACAVVVLEGGL